MNNRRMTWRRFYPGLKEYEWLDGKSDQGNMWFFGGSKNYQKNFVPLLYHHFLCNHFLFLFYDDYTKYTHACINKSSGSMIQTRVKNQIQSL